MDKKRLRNIWSQGLLLKTSLYKNFTPKQFYFLEGPLFCQGKSILLPLVTQVLRKWEQIAKG